MRAKKKERKRKVKKKCGFWLDFAEECQYVGQVPLANVLASAEELSESRVRRGLLLHGL